MPATVYEHDLAQRLLGYPDGYHCEFLLSFGYPADPADLTRPLRPAAASRSRTSSTRNAGRSAAYCQRNLRAAIPKQTTSQPTSTAAQTHSGANGAPPTITWRSASDR